MALGLIDNPPIDEQTIALETGDTLLLYTDGATEAHDPGYVEFGVAGLAAALAELHEAPATTICERLLAMIAGFQAVAPQHDDITLVAVQADARPLSARA